MQDVQICCSLQKSVNQSKNSVSGRCLAAIQLMYKLSYIYEYHTHTHTHTGKLPV